MKKFGELKQAIIDYLTENYQTESFKSSFKSIYKTINESKEFKEVFLLYSAIEESAFPNDEETAELFLNEAIDAIEDRGRSMKVVSIMRRLSDILKPRTNNPIYEAIDSIIYSNAATDIHKRVEAKKTLINHLKREDDKFNFEPVNEAVLITLLTNEYNEAFANINEEDKKILESYLNMSQEMINENISQKKESAIASLSDVSRNEEDETIVEKINETIMEIKNMENNRYNLFKLDNLLSDLNG